MFCLPIIHFGNSDTTAQCFRNYASHTRLRQREWPEFSLSCTGNHAILTALKTILILFSAISFTAYGSACLLSADMKREFERYRLGSRRTFVGVLQLCAAIGLLAGLSQPWMGRAASAGLAGMMIVAVGVRIKIRDTLLQTIPAQLYLALNAYLCLAAF